MPIDDVMGLNPREENQPAGMGHPVDHLRQVVRGRLQDTSSLPVAMFDVCDPMIEAVLAQAAANLFMDHMALTTDPDQFEPGEQRVEEVRPEEIQALCRKLAGESEPESPSLMSGLTRERLWVLLDLVVCGSPGARIQAATRLHETITEILNPSELDPVLLGQVAALLQEACIRDDMPTLLRDLLRQAAGRQLDNTESGEATS